MELITWNPLEFHKLPNKYLVLTWKVYQADQIFNFEAHIDVLKRDKVGLNNEKLLLGLNKMMSTKKLDDLNWHAF